MSGNPNSSDEISEEDSLLDWDDDDFELNHLDDLDEKLAKCGVAVPEANDDEEEVKEQDDDWLAKLTEEPAKVDKSNDDGELYLTAQFQSLNTAVSRKKHRCSACTRPLPENLLIVRTVPLCDGCSASQYPPKKIVRFLLPIEYYG